MRGPSFRRKINTLRRIFRSGFHNVFRNAWLATAAIAIMVVTLSIILGAIAANLALKETIDDISKDLTVSIFINDDAPEDKEEALVRTLMSNENVTTISYVSKKDALLDFQQRFPELQEGIEVTDGNPFPASHEVTLKNIDKFQDVVEIAESEQFADTVQKTSDNEQSRNAFNGFINARKFINKASLFAGGVFAAISMLVIFNTIRMAIFTRSDEIEIMKLIGARPSFIRGPFMVEACLYGLIAGLIASGVSYAALLGVGRRLSSGIVMEETLELFTTRWPWVLLAVVASGIMIGLVSSVIAMAKYLRLKRW